MSFYHFSQNNSGGSFHLDANLTVNVIIEANSANEANDKLEMLGGYFDGCREGRDCTCCGNRWDRTYENEGTDFPSIYLRSLEEFLRSNYMKWFSEGQNVVVHYADGRKEWH